MNNKTTWILFLAFLIPMTSIAQKKQITVENIWQEYAFWHSPISGFNFLNDGKHYSKIEQRGTVLVEYDLTSGKKTKDIFSANAFKEMKNAPNRFNGYAFSDDESKLLIETAQEKIYRHSTKANYFVWDRKGEKLTPVSSDGKQRLAAFNKDATKVGFVRDNNLFYKDLTTDKEIQITKDGKNNAIINGAADWVYEEEFGMSRAFSWSPDGTKIAFIRFDESEVQEFTMTLYNNELYPDKSTFKYPKAGEKNAKVSVHIHDLKTGKTIPSDIGEVEDGYLPRIVWTPKNQLCIFRINRHQNDLNLLMADSKTGKTTLLLNEVSKKYYVDLHDNLTFLDNGQFIWTSEKDGFNHIYLHNANGKQAKQLTKGKFDVTAFYGVDEKNKVVYYQAAKESPMQREVYNVALKGGKSKCLTKTKGTSSAQFSKTFDYFVNTHSDINTPPSYAVHDAKGKQVRMIHDNAGLKEKLGKYDMSKSEFINFKTSENVSLNGWMIKPPNFDKSKKHPVLMFTYGGPGSQKVEDSWGSFNYMWFQMLAQKGYIVACVDNRGTGARGEEFKKVTYMELGKYETIDQIESAKYLGGLPYVDASRIGIFGWSYGGYLSSLCLLKGNDVFKAAIAVAPVTNWKWYDTVYTERFMKTPRENKSGYEQNSPINFADQLKGNYLIVHGNADDNVHFQNTAEMVNALIKANKQFDTYFYPNRAHSIAKDQARLHLYTKMTNFILEKL